MLDVTAKAVNAILKADPSLSNADRNRILSSIHTRESAEQPKPKQPRILRRHEVASLFGKSLRWVDDLARSGMLCRRVLQGRKRAVGFLSTDVEALMLGGVA